MEQFVVSARKYRPITFDSVVGQHSITSTLKNAIRNHHLAQAFLFTGPRGVGKTTCARILAKTINCENLTPEIEPCNTCDSCVSFNQNASFNIYELDAASNNSVEDIRNLVEQVRIVPHKGKFKIYIIDEVHMLSNAAFNAFLKTLEEPPSYAIFILATTEKHKIIPTILSRCQIYDFNRIQIEDIANHLQFVASKEHVNAEPEALHVIAQKADGALRDALSIFDQVVSYSGNTLTYQHAIDNLNVLDYEYYFRITDHLISGTLAPALLLLNDVINNGFDGHNFIAGMSGHFRNLMVCRNEATLQLLETSPAAREKYRSQSAACSTGLLLAWLDMSNQADLQYKAAKHPRLLVELALMKMCNLAKPFASVASTDEKKKPEQQPVTEISTPKVIPPAQVETAAIPVAKLGTPPEPQIVAEPKVEMPAAAILPTPVSPDSVILNSQPQTEQERDMPIQEKAADPTPTPAAAPSVTPIGNMQRTLSISALRKQTKSPVEEQVQQEQRNFGSDPFTLEMLHAAWLDYAMIALEQGKKSVHAALTSSKPIINNQVDVEYTVGNSASFSTIHTDLCEHLRKTLNNYAIRLILTVSVEQDENPVPYTISEKFKKMAEKNPAMNHFKSKFNLELDF